MKRFIALFSILLVVFPTLGIWAIRGEVPTLTDRGAAAELTNTIWLNTKTPLKLADLRGKVTLLHFWTYGCINCQHTLPYIKDVYARLANKGVQVIGIHFPEFSAEREVANVEAFVAKNEITYPIAIDNDGVAWNAYEMHAWPAVELIDKQGRRRYRQLGEGNYENIEAALTALLAEDYMPVLKKSENPLVAQDRGVAPELLSKVWLNTPKSEPLTLKQLRGQVVLLEFWTFGCINCYRTLPAMRDWYDKYADKGLVQIGVHFPEFSYERELDNVKAFLTKESIRYPVAVDNDGATWAAYEQRFWPTMYLLDKQGHIRYVVIGEHDYATTEQAIKALLAE